MWWIAAVGMACAACGHVGFSGNDGSDATASADVATSDAADSSLLFHYTLDELSNTTTLDSVSARPAQCPTAGQCPTPVTGRIGGALEFSASDELQIAFDSALYTPSAYTITAWAFPTTGVDGSLFAWPAMSATTVWNTWQLEQVGGLASFTTSDTTSGNDKMTGTALPVSTWTHVAGVWDGATKRLYVNGVEVAAKPWTVYLEDTEPMLIGADNNDGADGLFYPAELDDIRLYSRALSAPEVAALASQ
ncbi:MAG TPA: LamG domain-containing protein [Kofleriaceae bacterium]|nr:LamG domain-containing protein [Kofleriaceae bacterium]